MLPPLKGKTPTRLDLARWIVDRSNPLTARVAVNWVWHKYFGRGIVPTLEDFGAQGEKPSHPDLLDYLAEEFMDHNWRLKDLHRLIVTSAGYRQASTARPDLHARDPYNALLARQSRLRLEAEVIRDTALTASGLLVKRVGGPSVRPPQPAGIAELSYAGQVHWIDSTGPDRYRRGLYTWFQRTSPYPMLLTFDAPDSNLCCVKPRALQYAVAGADAAQRRGVRRMRPGAGPARAEGEPGRRRRPAAVRVSALHGADADDCRTGPVEATV